MVDGQDSVHCGKRIQEISHPVTGSTNQWWVDTIRGTQLNLNICSVKLYSLFFLCILYLVAFLLAALLPVCVGVDVRFLSNQISASTCKFTTGSPDSNPNLISVTEALTKCIAGLPH